MDEIPDIRTLRAKLPERDLMSATLELAELLGWHCAHFRAGMTKSGNWVTPVAAQGAGFPDLVCVRDRVLFIEFKSSTGRLSPSQAEWGSRLLLAGAEYNTWWPADWYSGEIERVLRRRG